MYLCSGPGGGGIILLYMCVGGCVGGWVYGRAACCDSSHSILYSASLKTPSKLRKIQGWQSGQNAGEQEEGTGKSDRTGRVDSVLELMNETGCWEMGRIGKE